MTQASGVLLRLVSQGIEFKVAGEDLYFRPPNVSPNVEAEIRANRDALLNLLDAEVVARVECFQKELTVARPPRVPMFVYREGTPYEKGICFSCGHRLPQSAYGRCWRCSLAWRLVCRVPTTTASPFDEARVI